MNKQLKFIHITKTAGTSLENLGKDNNIEWGRFHKEYGYWHEIFPNKPKSLKEKYDWFMVVRNPYSRIVSEFHDKWYGVAENALQYSKYEFNEYVIEKILYYYNNSYYYNSKLGIMGGSYTPQYLYLDKNIEISIIKFENLKFDFESITQNKLGKKIELTTHALKAKKKFTINDLSVKAIALINKIYKKDFEKFNYEIIEVNKEFDFKVKNEINYSLFYEKAKLRYAYQDNNYIASADMAKRALIHDFSLLNLRDYLYFKRKTLERK